MRRKRYDISDGLLGQEKHHVQSDVSITENIHNNEKLLIMMKRITQSQGVWVSISTIERYGVGHTWVSCNSKYCGCRKKEMHG